MDFAISRNSVKIRLTAERWIHIVTGHNELAVYYYFVLHAIRYPDELYWDNMGKFYALYTIESGKHLVAVYREVDKNDGFVITAFIERNKGRTIKELEQLWP